MKKNVKEILDKLEINYPHVKCWLDFMKDFELLFAVRLSAQCTDARVNIVTKTLFQKYKTLEDYANADLAELETAEAVHPQSGVAVLRVRTREPSGTASVE